MSFHSFNVYSIKNGSGPCVFRFSSGLLIGNDGGFGGGAVCVQKDAKKAQPNKFLKTLHDKFTPQLLNLHQKSGSNSAAKGRVSRPSALRAQHKPKSIS